MNEGIESKHSEATPVQPLRHSVERAVEHYLRQLEGEQVTNLYQFVLAEMEQPLLTTVMRSVNGNQSRASQILGISRGTLRKKLAAYQIDSSRRST